MTKEDILVTCKKQKVIFGSKSPQRDERANQWDRSYNDQRIPFHFFFNRFLSPKLVQSTATDGTAQGTTFETTGKNNSFPSPGKANARFFSPKVQWGHSRRVLSLFLFPLHKYPIDEAPRHCTLMPWRIRRCTAPGGHLRCSCSKK